MQEENAVGEQFETFVKCENGGMNVNCSFAQTSNTKQSGSEPRRRGKHCYTNIAKLEFSYTKPPFSADKVTGAKGS